MSPERREELTGQWASEEPVPRGSLRHYARAMRRWVQGDRDRVINLGLDLEGGVHLLYEMHFPSEIEEARLRAQMAATQVEIIRNRVDELGIREPIIQREGDRRILIQMPGVKDATRAEELVGKPAQLKFHLVEGQDGTRKVLDGVDRALNGRLWPRLRYIEEGKKFVLAEADMDIVRNLLEEVRQLWPQGYIFAFETSPPPIERNRVLGLYLIREKEEMTGETLTNATGGANMDSAAGGWQVNLQFNARGATRFGIVTKEHVGEQLGAVIDGRVRSAPTIQEEILGGRARITGRFTDVEADDLAIALRSGALPVEMKKIEERTVGPTLGAESINKGVRAGLIGLAQHTAHNVRACMPGSYAHAAGHRRHYPHDGHGGRCERVDIRANTGGVPQGQDDPRRHRDRLLASISDHYRCKRHDAHCSARAVPVRHGTGQRVCRNIKHRNIRQCIHSYCGHTHGFRPAHQEANIPDLDYDELRAGYDFGFHR